MMKANYWSCFIILFCSLSMSVTTVTAGTRAVITPKGFFTDCEEAVAFRDGPLFEKFEKFSNAYDAQKEQGIKNGLAEFEKDRQAAERALQTAGKEQRKIIYIAITSLVASYIIGGATKRVLGKLPGAVGQKQALNAIVDSTNGLKVDIALSLAKGNLDGKSLLKNQAQSLVMDNVISAGEKGAGGPIIFIASNVYKIGSVAIPATFDALEKELDKDVARADINNIKMHVAKLMRKSISIDIHNNNKTREKIDSQCGHQDKEQMSSKDPEKELDEMSAEDFENELDKNEAKVENNSLARRSGNHRAPTMNDLLDEAKQNNDTQAQQLRDQSQRNLAAGATPILEQGVRSLAAEAPSAGNQGSGGGGKACPAYYVKNLRQEYREMGCARQMTLGCRQRVQIIRKCEAN